MRKCKTCGVDISHRGNRSQYCEEHAKEIRDKKVKANKKRKYGRDNPRSTMIGKRRLPTGGRPLCEGDSGDSYSGGRPHPPDELGVRLSPSKERLEQQERLLKPLKVSTENPLREYYYLYDRGKLSKSDYDKERYRQKKIRELHERQEASLKHKWRKRKPHPTYFRKQVDIINNPKYKDKKANKKRQEIRSKHISITRKYVKKWCRIGKLK